MWPVQTLTLLLCLTDDEQLYARVQPDVLDTLQIAAAAVKDELALDAADPFGCIEG